MSVWITRRADGPRGRRLAVKDLFDTAGVRTTYGSKVFENHVPRATAEAVQLLEADGWQSVGKTNLQEFAYGITSQNPHYGDVPNPRFPDRVAGGSSGGSAAAIVTEEADLGLGTDSGGSIRIPAACCEVVGFKPSSGVVPMDGCFPLAPSFDHAGPIAADTATCAAAIRALAGIEPEALGDLADLRVGLVWTEYADPDVRLGVEKAAAVLPRVERLALPLPEGVFPAFQHEVAGVHRELFGRCSGLYGPNVRAKVAACLDVSEREAVSSNVARERYRVEFARALRGFDLAVAPTLPVVPPRHDVDELDVRVEMTRLTFPLNAVGAPALALPCGRTPDGLPVSAQLFSRPGADALVLAAGALFESALRHTALPEREPQED
ncbi:MAG: amidase [Actinomycetota bacterium]|nr:amidase [Actinomycetota bacterium]